MGPNFHRFMGIRVHQNWGGGVSMLETRRVLVRTSNLAQFYGV